MSHRKDFASLFACCVLAACGGTDSDLEPGGGDSPGTGTSTLLVDGDLEARPRTVNARSAGDFDTHVSVRVSLSGQTVTSGTVSVTSRTATTPLVFDTSTGKWDATLIGYDEVYALYVESGADYVEGVRVDGPDIHFFTAPTAGATLDSTVPTPVSWEAEQIATAAAIDAEDLDKVSIPDEGTYTLAAGALKADKDRARENIIELVRTNRVTPAGAVAGSDVRVSVENRVQVIAQPNPAL